jgi:prepilin-type N-terminal cleavage/methylation domain-containing protein
MKIGLFRKRSAAKGGKGPILSQRAFSLIEMIGVLTVIAILATVLMPAFIRQMDKIAGDEESASLKSFGDGLQSSIQRNRYIPSYTNWASVVATELGLNLSDVTTNRRKKSRYFLIDPNWQIGAAPNPGQVYQQTTPGVPLPGNTRIIILSSIGDALPNMISGIPSVAGDFDAIWNWNDASSTPPPASLLNGFSRGEDLKIQRVNLSPLFVRLVLTVYASDGIPRYSIDSISCGGATYVTNLDNYFIKGTTLSLYTHMDCSDPNVMDSRHILTFDTSYVYNQNVWRSSIIGGATVGGLDVGTVVDKFLAAPPNLNPFVPHGTDQQRWVVTNMMAFMAAYDNWAGNNFPPGALKNTTSAKQQAMMDVVMGLFANGSGYKSTPSNGTPCVVQ